MKILGIDSSGLVASVAIVSGDAVVAEFTINNKKTHSQTLLPMVEQVVSFAGVELEEMDAVAVAAGPGSFTGLRIGAATVKGLGMVLDKPVVPVPTLEGLAYQMAESDGIICPMLDARRNQVYTGIYRIHGGELETLKSQAAMDIRELLEELGEYEEKIHFLGDGVPIFQSVIQDEFDGCFSFAPAHLSRQRAAALAVLGQKYYRAGKTVQAADFRPFYLRKSQAERERERRLNAD